MKYYHQSISKLESNVLNEDASIAKPRMIAVSDGAGGGGVFAELWSDYLLNKLPEEPIRSFHQLDAWMDAIWEPYYKDCEEKAKQQGALFLNKFYDEGSFATLSAVWLSSERRAEWMTYGDSVAFCYDFKNHRLEYSDIRLATFDHAPFLIGSTAELKEEGYHQGSFTLGDEHVLFVATDALSHYILMMYELGHREDYQEELSEAVSAKTKNSNFIKVAKEGATDFEAVLSQLLDASRDQASFSELMSHLEHAGLLAHDDYSLAVWDGRADDKKRGNIKLSNQRYMTRRRKDPIRKRMTLQEYYRILKRASREPFCSVKVIK